MWEDLLGIRGIGINDNFFELGGHSLLATRLISQLHKVFQVKVPLRRIFDTRTIAGLASVIEQIMIAEVAALSDAEVGSLLSRANNRE